MRRTDREITDINDIISVIKKCDVCRLAMHDDEYPYILPLNFGIRAVGNDITLYFHGALEGKKYDLIRKNNKVSFEMDCSLALIPNENPAKCSMEYESVIGSGTIEFVRGDEKLEALNILMGHYCPDRSFEFSESAVQATEILKLSVSAINGKRNVK